VNELPYHRQNIRMEMWVSRIGSSSLDLSSRATDLSGDTVYLLAETTQAMRELSTRKPHRFSEREVTVLNEYLDKPNEFR
jgi:acyl-CoA thioesterase FadM